MKKVTLKAPATIANFGPGFDIFALALKRPYDVIQIQETKSGPITINITGESEPLPLDPKKNSAGVAAAAYFKATGRRAGCRIDIQKHIKPRAGLGTSGASAAAAVYGLNKIFCDNMDADQLIDIARQGEIASGSTAHADNAAGCLLGGFILIKNYSPLSIKKIKTPVIPFVLCAMKKKHLTTRGNIPSAFSLDRLTGQMSRAASVIHAIMTGDLKEMGRAVSTDFVSEPVRAQDITGYLQLKKDIIDAGAYGCNISGGGSTVFAICPDEVRNKISRIMQDYLQKFQLDGEVIQTQSCNEGIKEIHGL